MGHENCHDAVDSNSISVSRHDFKAKDVVWAYNNVRELWQRAQIIIIGRPTDFVDEDFDIEQTDVYVHWKGYDRRLDSWVSADKILPLTTEVKSDFEIEQVESDDHEGVDQSYLIAHQENTKLKTINAIQLGAWQISCWYFSPYPKKVQNVRLLYICEFCLSFFRYQIELYKHRKRCVLLHPPGNEIHRDGELSMWEIDGSVQTSYCENLCYLSKLFLDHKTLRHPVSLFLFYVLTRLESDGHKLVGYFSREKYSRNNVSCILVLPNYQRYGYGKYLINFSYALSLKSYSRGTPERPLSDLGKLSYLSYWRSCLLQVMSQLDEASIEDLSTLLGFLPSDIEWTLKEFNLLNSSEDGQIEFIYIPEDFEPPPIDSKGLVKPINQNDLIWVPYDSFLSPFELSIS